jgi:SlyX protein
MSKLSLEDRIIELETRLEFQDETIGRLNDEVLTQQQQVLQLHKALELLQKRLRESSAVDLEPVIDAADEPPPPHY